MNLNIQKHWPSFLGALFVLAAFIYLFQYTLDQAWITDTMKIGFGLLCGAGLSVSGVASAMKRTKTLIGEILMGIGVGVLFATFSFAGIYYSMWDSITVLLCMAAVTVGLTAFSFRFNSRVLMNVALLGGIAAPLLMRPETDQVFALFLYLFVINSAYFFLSIRKGWTELRFIAFVGTWLMYAVYYIHFDPLTDQIWSLPFRYAVAAFIFYSIAFVFSSWKNNLNFDGLHMYLSLVNGVMFGLWSTVILSGIVSFTVPLAFMGILYVATGFLVSHLSGKFVLSAKSYLLAGTFLLLLSLTQLGKGMEVKPLISVLIWGLIAAVLVWIGIYKKLAALNLASVIIWLIAGTYWYAVTWHTPRGEWFGTFIPFLNWGAVSWMVLAYLGFYYSVMLRFSQVGDDVNRLLSTLYALFSHLIVGGLLTVQLCNAFEEYGWDIDTALDLTLSVTWAIYAVLLFVWGAYNKQSAFRFFGSIVLLLVAIKAIFIDLAGEQTLYKVLVLLVLGGISFFISWINGIWKEQELRAKNDLLEQNDHSSERLES